MVSDAKELERHDWRLERYLELGYPRHLAEVLELAHVDWHELARLLEDGCPPQIALEILT